jgi:anti-sigma regulatory factor (Ser/Thr protein kinase)
MTVRRNARSEVSRRSVRLPEDVSAPRVARDAVDGWLCDADPEVRRDARSVVSELVTDAVRQGSPPIEITVEQRGGWTRIEVADAGVGSGRQPAEAWAQRIVEGLAARWGLRDDAHVWFELPVRASEAGDRLA